MLFHAVVLRLPLASNPMLNPYTFKVKYIFLKGVCRIKFNFYFTACSGKILFGWSTAMSNLQVVR